MEKDEKKINFREKEDALTSTTTPSISGKLENIYTNMEKIPEQNESLYEEHKSFHNSKEPNPYEGYKQRNPSELDTRSLLKKDSVSIIEEMNKNICCLKKKKIHVGNRSEIVTKIECRIF